MDSESFSCPLKRGKLTVLAEQNDEWQVCRKYFSAESLSKLTGQQAGPGPALLAG